MRSIIIIIICFLFKAYDDKLNSPFSISSVILSLYPVLSGKLKKPTTTSNNIIFFYIIHYPLQHMSHDENSRKCLFIRLYPIGNLQLAGTVSISVSVNSFTALSAMYIYYYILTTHR